jgi:uncharacterized protein YkwD
MTMTIQKIRMGHVWFVLALATMLLHSCAGSSIGSTAGTGTITATEQAIIDELNLARTNPRMYARLLEDTRQYFDGKRYFEPGQKAMRTQEGVAAVDEAIRYLRSVPPASPLSASSGLAKAALDHIRDTGPKGMVSHTGSDGSTPRQRVERHGRWQTTLGENIAYHPMPSARRIVMLLIVDDGVPDRGHRTIIFNPAYKVVGVATGPHSLYGSMCVQEFAGGFSGNKPAF